MNEYRKTTKRLAHLIGAISFVVSGFLFVAVMDTIYLPPPYVEMDATASVRYSDSGTTVHINRTFKSDNDTIASVASVLTSKQAQLGVPATAQSMFLTDLRVGEDIAYERIFAVPPSLKGEWCIDSQIFYRYRLSMRQHAATLRKVCVYL